MRKISRRFLRWTPNNRKARHNGRISPRGRNEPLQSDGQLDRSRRKTAMGRSSNHVPISASAPRLLLLERILDGRRGLPNAAHAHRRAVGDEHQLVLTAFAVGRGAGDVGHLSRSEIAGLAAGTG